MNGYRTVDRQFNVTYSEVDQRERHPHGNISQADKNIRIQLWRQEKECKAIMKLNKNYQKNISHTKAGCLFCSLSYPQCSNHCLVLSKYSIQWSTLSREGWVPRPSVDA